MIYRLTDEFTKIEEMEGVLENKSVHSRIEIVVTDEVPVKDTGIELQPKEKMPFSVKAGKNLYARCNDMEHMGANLAVVNFNVPASGGSGAGADVGDVTLAYILKKGYVKANGQELKRNDYPNLYSFAKSNELILPDSEWVNGSQGLYSEGDGETTFRIPDIRGNFLRALNDGAGMGAERFVGSLQTDAIRNITGNIYAIPATSSIHAADGVFEVEYEELAETALDTPKICKTAFSFDASRVVPTAEENRPKNIALIAQIKY